jgi:hypothetical protein
MFRTLCELTVYHFEDLNNILFSHSASTYGMFYTLHLIVFLSPLVGRNFLGYRKLNPHAYDRIRNQKNEILVSNPLPGKDTVSTNIWLET